jgi:hypothetical protein
MSSSPLESGFNTRDWPVKTGNSEVIHLDEKRPTRGCGAPKARVTL